MASVHFAFVKAMDGIVPSYGGQPVGEIETGGGATTATCPGAGFVCRAHAISGASYVRLGGGTVAATTANGFYLAEGQTIDLHGSPGDQARQDDV